MQENKEERAYVHIMQICNGARMHASHRVHIAYQRDGNVHDRRLLDATAG